MNEISSEEEVALENARERTTLPIRENWPSWLWLVTVIAVGVIIGLGSIDLIRPIVRPLALFVLGITIASALSPAVNWLGLHLGRGLGIAAVYLILILVIVGIGFLVVPLLVAQGRDFATRAPALITEAQELMNDIVPLNLSQVGSFLGAFSSAIVSLPVMVVNSLLDIILIFFVSLYWLILNPQLKAFLLSLFPAEKHSRVLKIFQDMGQGMGGYLRASAINGVIIGVLTYLGLVIIGVNFPAVLALIMGLLEIIPALGPTIGGTLIVLVSILQSPKLAIIAIIFVVVLQQAEGHILVPNVVKSQTEISPLLVIFALVCGAASGGLLGVLVSIPVAAAVKVLVDAFVAPAIRRRTGAVVD